MPTLLSLGLYQKPLPLIFALSGGLYVDNSGLTTVISGMQQCSKDAQV